MAAMHEEEVVETPECGKKNIIAIYDFYIKIPSGLTSCFSFCSKLWSH
jgi:hypothetical protein